MSKTPSSETPNLQMPIWWERGKFFSRLEPGSMKFADGTFTFVNDDNQEMIRLPAADIKRTKLVRGRYVPQPLAIRIYPKQGSVIKLVRSMDTKHDKQARMMSFMTWSEAFAKAGIPSTSKPKFVARYIIYIIGLVVSALIGLTYAIATKK